jgi:hypothetical protein
MNFTESFFSDIPGYHISCYSMTPFEGLKLKWNGEHLGEIDKYVVAYRRNDYDDCIFLWEFRSKKLNLTEVRIMKYKDDIPLIADDLKALFQLPQAGKHRAILKGQECIITRYLGDVSYENYFCGKDKEALSPGFIQEIRRLYVFRYLICLNCNYENRIEIRTGLGAHFPISCRENTYSLNPIDSASRIPKNVIKEWFEDKDEMVIDIAKEMLDGKDITMFKFQISDAIRKYEHGRYISWVNAIYDRIRNMAGM